MQQPNVKSTVLELSLEDTSPRRGRDILNTLLDVYVQSNLNDKNREASNTLKFIEDRLGLLTGELGDVEGEVATYKSSRGLTDIGSEAQIFLENIQENDTKLNEVNNQMQVLESVDAFVDANGGTAAPATYMINDPVLVSLLSRLTDLQIAAGALRPHHAGRQPPARNRQHPDRLHQAVHPREPPEPAPGTERHQAEPRIHQHPLFGGPAHHAAEGTRVRGHQAAADHQGESVPLPAAEARGNRPGLRLDGDRQPPGRLAQNLL